MKCQLRMRCEMNINFYVYLLYGRVGQSGNEEEEIKCMKCWTDKSKYKYSL